MKNLLKIIILIFVLMPLALVSDPVELERQVGDQAGSLERLLEGLSENEKIEPQVKQKIIKLLKELQERDIKFDVELIIEDLENEVFDEALSSSKNLLSFLKELRTVVTDLPELTKNVSQDSMQKILKAQQDIRAQLQKLMKQIHNPLISQVKKNLNNAQKLKQWNQTIKKHTQEFEQLEKSDQEGDTGPLQDFMGAQNPQQARERAQLYKNRLQEERKSFAKNQNNLLAELKQLSKELEKSDEDQSNKEQDGDSKYQQAIDQAANHLSQSMFDQTVASLQKLLDQLKDEQNQKMSPEEKKTIEHLEEKQKELAERYQDFLDQETFSRNENKKKMRTQVDQMNRIAKKVRKGELDSGVWESLALEKELAELIEKMKFDLNRYAMDQRLVNLSDFVDFLEDLQARQLSLHERWRLGQANNDLISNTLKEQESIYAHSLGRNNSLESIESLSFLYGMKRVQSLFVEFISILKSNRLPELQAQQQLEMYLDDLLDGLKTLKGRLGQKRQRSKKRESHNGQDIESQEVSLIEETRYLRLLQMDLNHNRLKDPKNPQWQQEQKELLNILMQIKSRWKKQEEQ